MYIYNISSLRVKLGAQSSNQASKRTSFNSAYHVSGHTAAVSPPSTEQHLDFVCARLLLKHLIESARIPRN